MNFNRRWWLLLPFYFVALGVASAQASGDAAGASLADVARQIRTTKELGANQRRQERIGISEGDYKRKISELFRHKDFDQLEKLAAEARSDKGRFAGGPWKLYAFYDAINKPELGIDAPDSAWNSHLAILREWISVKRASVT